jgi:ABC-type transport system involved in multi-copper enzyme maturation permease subunit
MLGPVFNAEMLRATRRGRAQTLRWVYAGWLCLQLVYVYDLTHTALTYGLPPQAPASLSKAASNFGQQYRDLVLSQQFTLIVLVTPAFVAGAITDEKTRGTLQGLLTAYVTPADIVLGKLAARITQVGILALTPLPLLALVGQFAGVTPEFLFALLAVTAVLLIGLGGLSMLASVWFRQTRWAVLATYAVLFAGYLLTKYGFPISYGGFPDSWTDYFGLIRVLDPLVDRDDPAEAVRRFGQAAVAWGGLGVATTTLAVWRLRPAYLRQLEARPRRSLFTRSTSRSLPARDVMAWKESQVGRRVPLWLGVLLTGAVAGGVTAYVIYGSGTRFPWRDAVAYLLYQVGIYSFVLATLMVGVRCSGSITGERERSTWDGLMTSPLTVRELVRGKHRGAMRATWPYLLAAWFGATALTGMAVHSDPKIAVGFALAALGFGGLAMRFAPRALTWVSLGLVMMMAATGGLEAAFVTTLSLAFSWLAMYFLGAVGMFCSARSISSWKSLLGTVVLGYLGGSVLMSVSSLFGCLLFFILWIAAQVVSGSLERADWVAIMPLGYAIAWGTVFWVVARSFLSSAERIVAKRDRIAPDWVRMIEYDMPRYGPTRPRPRR